MSTEQQISTEKLNSFVDGQLGVDEEDQILRAMDADPDVSKQICQLRQVKSMVRHAYQVSPAPPIRDEERVPVAITGMKGKWIWILFLVIGISAGWSSKSVFDILQEPGPSLAWVNPSQQDQKKVLLHLETNDVQRIEKALVRIETWLAQPGNRTGKMEIVANGSGIHWVNAGNSSSTHSQRLQRLLMEYDNVAIKACQKTMNHLRNSGKAIRLQDNIQTTPSALEQIVKRLHQGWVYIKV